MGFAEHNHAPKRKNPLECVDCKTQSCMPQFLYGNKTTEALQATNVSHSTVKHFLAL